MKNSQVIRDVCFIIDPLLVFIFMPTVGSTHTQPPFWCLSVLTSFLFSIKLNLSCEQVSRDLAELIR